MVPAWPQVLSQVLSQPCPKSWPNPVPMSLFLSCPHGLARVPYVRSKLAQVDK